MLKAEAEHFIDLERSYMIGDSLRDIQAGKNAGLKTILVMTGDGKKEATKLGLSRRWQPDFQAATLLEAAKLIRAKGLGEKEP